jgi:hypothetical protein
MNLGEVILCESVNLLFLIPVVLGLVMLMHWLSYYEKEPIISRRRFSAVRPVPRFSRLIYRISAPKLESSMKRLRIP